MGIYKRGKTYYVDYYVGGRGGKRVRERVGANKEDAKLVEADRLNALRLGINPMLRRAKPIPFREASERIMREYYDRTSECPEQFEYKRAPLVEFFGDTPLSLIDRPALNRYVAWRSVQPKKKRGKGTISNAAINREIAFLSKLFTWAKYEAAIYLGDNPCSHFRLKEEEPDKDHYLTPAQADKLIRHAADHLQPIIRFNLETSSRIGALLLLEWPQVDLTPGAERVTFLADTTKAHKTYSVPLTPEAVAVLREIGRVRSLKHQRVFSFNGRPLGKIGHAFRQAVRRAGLPSWVTPHTM